MKCPRCGNTTSFYELNGRYYCRDCIAFNRVFVDESHEKRVIQVPPQKVSYHLNFTLSTRQQEISQRLIVNYRKKRNTLIMAVCGSGKTEISFGVIAYVLNHGGRVCFTIPRKALCIELYDRFVDAFDAITIGLFYGGMQKHPEASFIICTTHQLYRFVETPFDLILIDEADAFPFYGDRVLNAFFDQCVGGVFIKMSATLTSSDIHDEDVLIMNRRYHGHDLPVPHVRLLPHPLDLFYLIYLVKKLSSRSQKILIYVPTKACLPYYVKRLSPFFKVAGVSSLSSDMNERLDDLRAGHLDALITTTILERGVTITNVQAIVMQASHPIFDERTLMQISGRVGRKIGYEDGLIIFCDRYFSKEMKQCIKTIKKLNRMSV